MYLKSIELSGFKSFAKKSELKFTTPISAVVGPNGSGKSNIAEAFRFVLGEQSIKTDIVMPEREKENVLL
jgi:chromosome segregation protein